MIVITTAMDNEYELVKSHLEGAHRYKGHIRGYLACEEVILLKTGIGKVNAASSLAEILCSLVQIDEVISVGCAGAAVEDLSVGDIVVGNSFCYHDVWCGDLNMNGQVQGMPAVFPARFTVLTGYKSFRLGTIATGDWFVTSKEKVEEIKSFLPKNYNVCAIDMESAALAQVCYKECIPYNSIRVISDNPLLPNQRKQYEHFWDKMANKAFEALIQLI